VGMRMEQTLSLLSPCQSVVNPRVILRLIWKGAITNHKFLIWQSILSYRTGGCNDNVFDMNL
jgi:hypothetical protein